LNDANETALKLARKAEPDTRGRLRAWLVGELDGYPTLICLSYIEEGEVAASVIWTDRLRLADLDMIAGHMNAEVGVGDTMVAMLTSQYTNRAAMPSILNSEIANQGAKGSEAIH
jgi:hypothetical protein